MKKLTLLKNIWEGIGIFLKKLRKHLGIMFFKMFSVKFMFSVFLGYLMNKEISKEVVTNDTLVIGLGVMIVLLLFFREGAKIADWVIKYKHGNSKELEEERII